MYRKGCKNIKSIDDLIFVIKKSIKIDTNGCWIWQKQINQAGYGMQWFKNKNNRVHRLMYEIHYGKTDLLVCHKCDVKACCNPLHLFAGTHKDNYQDYINKFKKINTNPLKGEKHTNSKLNEQIVLEILKLSKTLGCTAISKKLKLNRSTVKNVVLGASWKHVTNLND